MRRLGALRVKASGSLAQQPAGMVRAGADWDAEVVEVDAAELVAVGDVCGERLARAALGANRLVPRRASAGRCDQRSRAPATRRIRICGVSRPAISAGCVERINLERDLVTALTGGCRKVVAGYTVKREYVNVEYLGRDREYRLRCDRGSSFPDVHPHREAQGLSLERLAHARHRRRARGRLEPDRRHDRPVRTADGLRGGRPGPAAVTL